MGLQFLGKKEESPYDYEGKQRQRNGTSRRLIYVYIYKENSPQLSIVVIVDEYKMNLTVNYPTNMLV